MEWQCKNEASVHRTAKGIRRRSQACSQVTSILPQIINCNATAHWKDKPVECLENAAIYAVANCCQSILTTRYLHTRYLSFWRKREAKADQCQTSFYRSVIIIMLLCQHLGMAPEEGAYKNLCQILHISPPYAFDVDYWQNGGRTVYMRVTTVCSNKASMGFTALTWWWTVAIE